MSTRASNPSFEDVFRSTFAQVVRFAARRVPDAAEAADVVSATYLEALTHWERYDSRRGEASVWLLGIARNMCAREGRRRAQEAHARAQIAGRRLLTNDEFEELEAVIDAVRLAPAVVLALRGLSDVDRELFRLTQEDELTTVQAAAVLEMPAVTARMRLMRVRRRLAAELGCPDTAGARVADVREP